MTFDELNNYIQNPDKTLNHELVTGYECFPEHAAEQFATSMKQYEQNTGRQHNDNSRLLYHLRQSFKPGEIEPDMANKIGYELALEFTGGNHAFVVATHTDKKHIHNHVLINAFNLNSDGKFKDPWYSGKSVVAKISDRICKEYELSVIDIKHGWSIPYSEWAKQQGIVKEPSKRKQLENIISLCLDKEPKDLQELLKLLAEHDCIAKKRGKEISIKTPFSDINFRLSSLSHEFREDELTKKIEQMQNKVATHEPPTPSKESIKKVSKVELAVAKPKELQLIIDINNSLKATENIGYKKWAEKFNLEQMSQTLLFIQKHELTLHKLETMATQKPKTLQSIKAEIEAKDEQLQQISLLQRHIGNYGKTKEIYKQYKKSATPEQFREDNSKAINDHENATSYFSEQGYGFKSDNKLPTIKNLREQYATHNADKKSLWAKYHEIRNADKEIDNAWGNVKTLLNLKDSTDIIATRDNAKQPNAPNL